jgi:ketosteroid isomerase-like protein
MPQNNRELVQGLYDCYLKGDLNGVLASFDEHIEWRTPGSSNLPTAGVRHGRGEVREFFQLVTTLFDFQDFKIEAMLADGERVAVLGSDTIIMKGTGARIPMTWAHVYTIREGKVTRFHEYLDTATVAAEYHRRALRV